VSQINLCIQTPDKHKIQVSKSPYAERHLSYYLSFLSCTLKITWQSTHTRILVAAAATATFGFGLTDLFFQSYSRFSWENLWESLQKNFGYNHTWWAKKRTNFLHTSFVTLLFSNRIYCKFTAECDSERTLKIGQHLTSYDKNSVAYFLDSSYIQIYVAIKTFCM